MSKAAERLIQVRWITAFDSIEVSGDLEEHNFSGVGEAVSLFGKGSRKSRRREHGDGELRFISF